MAKVCLCLTGRTIARDLEVLEKYRRWVDVVELRVDYLDPDERFYIRRFPALAGVPSILTVRRKREGGRFTEGEGARIILLAGGLAFADTEKRRNFAYVDLEEDLDVPSLEEAARTFGTRIIRSFHDFHGVPADISQRLQALRRNGDEIAKVAVMPNNLADTERLFAAAAENEQAEKIILGMGPFGASTRMLAGRMGSVLCYTSPRDEPDLECAGPGQPDPIDLVDTYRFRVIRSSTKLFGVIGDPLVAPVAPGLQNPAFARIAMDAVYLPFRTDDPARFFSFADRIGIQGVSIAFPFEERILPFLSGRSAEVDRIGACNLAIRVPGGWYGYNTAAESFSATLLERLNRTRLTRQRVVLLGAGGAAKAVAAELHRLGARVCILDRTEFRARDLAERYGFSWGALDGRGVQLLAKFGRIIIQATSVGMNPQPDADPLELYRFTGKETVMDLVYNPPRTRMLERAAAAGCATISGRQMLERQVRVQFKILSGLEFPR